MVCGQGQRWATKQDHWGGVRGLASCGDRGNRVGGPPCGFVGLAVSRGRKLEAWVLACWAGLRVARAEARGARVPSGCAPRRCVQAWGTRTLHFWVLHEHKEGVAQRGAHGLGAPKEQVVRGHQQGIHVEVAVRVLLLLRRLRVGAVSWARRSRPDTGHGLRSAQPLLGVSSVPPLFNFLWSGSLGSSEGRGGIEKFPALGPQ